MIEPLKSTVRSSIIIEIDFENKLIKGGKKGRSLGSLNSIIEELFNTSPEKEIICKRFVLVMI